jgi:hypothetical protein
MTPDDSLLNIIRGADVTDDEDIALRKSLVSTLRVRRFDGSAPEVGGPRRRTSDRVASPTIH